MKLTPKQREVLECGAEGVCIRLVWVWVLHGEPVTRQVNALIKRGLMRASYYRGGHAAVNATDAGRALLS